MSPLEGAVAVPISVVRSKNSTLVTLPLGERAAAESLIDEGAATTAPASGESSARTGLADFSASASENASGGTTSRGMDWLDQRTRQIMKPSGEVYSSLKGTILPAVRLTLVLVYSPPSPFHWSMTSCSSTQRRTRRWTSTWKR